MCGICGASEDRGGGAVRAMCARLVYRGPDDEGVYVDAEGGFALGARRLAVIDLEGGHQPLANEDASVWAVLNGEIYNHPALQEQLRRRGHVLRTRTDTEVLVHLYEDYGDQLVHALEGMYAFAIWDRQRRRLLIARDRFGEKPLFYREAQGGLTFASELTALAGGIGAPLRLSPRALSDCFVLGYVGGEDSIAQGVRQLLPGHLLTWSRDDPVVRTRRYWRAPEPASSDGRSRRELTAELELLLRDAVRSRLIADVPVGVFLSGGLDSSLVALLAAQEHGRRLKTFNVSYQAGSVNEDAKARSIARRLGVEHAEIALDQADVQRRVPGVLGALDQPIADPALIALNAVAELARPRITVALGGEGADELFGGYPRYRWIEAALALRGAMPAPVATRLGARLRRIPTGLGRAQRVADLLDARDLVDVHLDWVTAGRRQLLQPLSGPLLARTDGSGVLADARAIVGNPERGQVASRLMELDRCSWLPDDVLAKADRATMLCSLEMRTPFLERSLVEFATSIPAGRHVWPVGKALLREVYRSASGQRITPAKTAFRVPTGEWLRGPLRALAEHHLHDGRLVEEGWLERGALARLLREHLAGVDRSGALWPALSLGVWLEGAGNGFAAP